MTIKELLGNAYKEGMTLEEVETALLSVNLPQSDNGSELDRLRAALTKANSEEAAAHETDRRRSKSGTGRRRQKTASGSI